MPFTVGQKLRVKSGDSKELEKSWADVVSLHAGQEAEVVVADEGSDFFHVKAKGGATFPCQYSAHQDEAFEAVSDQPAGTTP